MLHPVGLYTSRGTTDPTGTDLSDGFAAIIGTAPDYWRAEDQSSGTISTLVARIGTNGVGGNTPTYNATGISGQPSFDHDSNDYISINQYAAAQAADPNATYSFAMPIRRTVATTGYVLAFGDPTDDLMTHGWYIDSSGNVGFFTRTKTSTGDPLENLLGASAIPLNTDTILVCSYRGTSCEAVTVSASDVGTIRLPSTATIALSPTDFPVTDCWIGRAPRTTAPVTLPARYGGLIFQRTAWDTDMMFAIGKRYADLYPPA